MEPTATPALERLELLGLKSDRIALEAMTPAIAALACFPMYMVANVRL